MNEIWNVGKHKSVVVSDTKQRNTNFPSSLNPSESEESDIEYYGGYLVCESVGNQKTSKLISAAPELLEALHEMVRMYEEVQPCGGWQGVYDSAKSAIIKAQ